MDEFEKKMEKMHFDMNDMKSKMKFVHNRIEIITMENRILKRCFTPEEVEEIEAEALEALGIEAVEEARSNMTLVPDDK